MAPTIKWQRWDSASYNWAGTAATDALPSLEAELDAWITAVNGNASNTGRQITKERGYADSTTANYHGLVISAGANNNTAKGYLGFGTYGTATTKKLYAGDTYADNTTNGGYGTISGGVIDTTVSWYSSGQEANFLIIYDTTDGEEFFLFGPSMPANPTTNYSEGFYIMKCTDGEWSMFANDGSVYVHTHYWNDALSTGWDNCARNTTADTSTNAGTYGYGRFDLNPQSGLDIADPATQGRIDVYAANPNLIQRSASSTYYYTGNRRVLTTLGTGQDVYVVTSAYYGPSVLIDLRS